jgi:glycosyltransferase involved in cell wall biosynthesis
VLEALCCGKPAIVTQTGGVQELIEEGINGYKVPVRDIQALTNKMEFMILNYGKFDTKKISQEAINLYSYEKVGLQFSNCYTRILKAKTTGS